MKHTFGSCQRPVISLGVSHHIKQQICEMLDSIGHKSCKRIVGGKKTPLLHKFVFFQMPEQIFKEKLHLLIQKLPLSQKLHYMRGSCFKHNVLYYQ